jgi:hypothetical protein
MLSGQAKQLQRCPAGRDAASGLDHLARAAVQVFNPLAVQIIRRIIGGKPRNGTAWAQAPRHIGAITG